MSQEIPSGAPRRLARAWLWLGLAALTGSGLLAILLVFSRTPGFQEFFPLRDFFRSALIVHVDLSVAVWFMAFAAVLWSAYGRASLASLGWTAVALAGLGTAVMVLSPFFPDAQPLLNNYIPVLRQPVFFAGLGLCGAGFALAILRALLTCAPPNPLTMPVQTGVFLAAVVGALALGIFYATWKRLPAGDDQLYYEMLFWGGGHALQFQHALLLAAGWLILGQALGAEASMGSAGLSGAFLLSALPAFASAAIAMAFPPSSGNYIAKFAQLMVWGHMAMAPLILAGGIGLWRVRKVVAPAKTALAASFLLFGVGGILGFLIDGANVVIPAHYHGAIVGVTLCFMGLAYVMLPRLGFRPVAGKWARWQPAIYGGGQLMHILGLAWSGGYGVQRKVAGAEQVLTSLPQKIGMGMMGLGGAIAIVGGIIFVVVCLKAMKPDSPPPVPSDARPA